MTQNYKALAKLLCTHSTALKKDEHVLLDICDTPEEMVMALIEAVQECGAHPHLELSNPRLSRKLALLSKKERLETVCDTQLYKFKKMQAYIAIRGANNIFENCDIEDSQMKLITTELRPIVDYRVNKLKWVVLRWPTSAMAQLAMMSTEAFTDFYFKVCTLDYSKMSEGMNALKNLMQKTDKVRILGLGTDLKFSIKNIPAITCGGQYNIPDGEVFTAPVKDSVNGYVTYNAPSIYNGISFDNVRLEFENGKIVNATASSNTDKLNQILDTDAGARYIGEFALGFNPHITSPMRDILFDEKIAGSFHFTPGQSYADASNGNESKVHWDLVCIQTPQYGGGEIYFDDILVRKDGIFTLEELKLNPEHLL